MILFVTFALGVLAGTCMRAERPGFITVVCPSGLSPGQTVPVDFLYAHEAKKKIMIEVSPVRQTKTIKIYKPPKRDPGLPSPDSATNKLSRECGVTCGTKMIE